MGVLVRVFHNTKLFQSSQKSSFSSLAFKIISKRKTALIRKPNMKQESVCPGNVEAIGATKLENEKELSLSLQVPGFSCRSQETPNTPTCTEINQLSCAACLLRADSISSSVCRKGGAIIMWWLSPVPGENNSSQVSKISLPENPSSVTPQRERHCHFSSKIKSLRACLPSSEGVKSLIKWKFT